MHPVCSAITYVGLWIFFGSILGKMNALHVRYVNLYVFVARLHWQWALLQQVLQ